MAQGTASVALSRRQSWCAGGWSLSAASIRAMAQSMAGAALFRHPHRGCARGGPLARSLCGQWRMVWQAWHFLDTRGCVPGVVSERGFHVVHGAGHSRRGTFSTPEGVRGRWSLSAVSMRAMGQGAAG
eukprot:8146545-Pyramimonas_sp.AAC.1